MKKLKQKICTNCGRKNECTFEVYIGELVICPKKTRLDLPPKTRKTALETPDNIMANYGKKQDNVKTSLHCPVARDKEKAVAVDTKQTKGGLNG